MALQNSSDIVVGFKAQTTLGTEEAAAADATKMLYKSGSAGFSPPDAVLIESQINQGDGMTTKGRRGTHNAPGQFVWEGNTSAHDLLYENFFRNAASAAITKTQADLGQLTVASNVITFATGNPITEGVSVGDVVKFSAGLDAADLGKWLRVKALTTTTMEVFDTITDVGVAADFSFIRPKKFLQSNQEPIITFAQYFQQLDRSHVIRDATGNRVQFALQENQTLDVTGDFLGTTSVYKATGASPHFTDPVDPGGESLAFLDACFAINGADNVLVTGMTLGIDLRASTLAVANKTGISPKVFQSAGKPTGQFTVAMEDFTLLEAAAAETTIDFHATFIDPSSAAGVLHLSMTNCISSSEAFSPFGNDGAETMTFDLDAGRDTRGGAYDRTGVKLLLSAV